jgi:hypothetical protein
MHLTIIKMIIIRNGERKMEVKQLQKGVQAKIASTGQVVEVKRVSNHGFSVVRFQTGGDYMILNDRLETFEKEEVQH